MRHKKFLCGDIHERPACNTLITKGPAFQFDVLDIKRIRKELKTLIDNLSIQFLRMEENAQQL